MIERVLDPVLEAVLAALMAVMIAAVFTGVVYRYVLVSPLAWPEEVARLCLVWITFLGSYLALRRGSHMVLSLLYDRLAPAARRRADIVGHLVLAGFLLLLILYGGRYVQRFAGARSPFLEMPLAFSYVALPVGAGLMLLATLARLHRTVRRR